MAEGDWTILKVLSWTSERFEREGLPSARLDAEVLLAHCLGVERIRLYMDFDKPLLPAELERFRALVRRRLAHEPVAYLTSRREFWSLSLEVSPAVLIPRPETELLVQVGLELAGRIGPHGLGGEGLIVVDACTGSGAVAAALSVELEGARMIATEIAAGALEIARRNFARLAPRATLLEGDLLEPVEPGHPSIDLVVANPPYVPTDQIDHLQREIREHEPRVALDGGPDGLAVVRRLAETALPRLSPGGYLALEIGFDQSERLGELLRGFGYASVEIHPDLDGIPRVVSGMREVER
jgi:release factor glutamine methyltransferase